MLYSFQVVNSPFKINVFSTTYNRGIFSTFSTSNFNGIYFADSGTQSTSTSNMWFWADGNSLYRIPYIFATNTWYFVMFSIINGEIYVYLNDIHHLPLSILHFHL
jgi:hypothetical protein